MSTRTAASNSTWMPACRSTDQFGGLVTRLLGLGHVRGMVPSGTPCAGRRPGHPSIRLAPERGRWIHSPAYAEELEKGLRAKGVAPRRFKRLMPQPSLPGRARLTEHEDGHERARAAKRLIPEGGAGSGHSRRRAARVGAREWSPAASSAASSTAKRLASKPRRGRCDPAGQARSRRSAR
jgi:hypothetical protein